MKKIVYYIIGSAVTGLLAGVILIDFILSAFIPGMFWIFTASSIVILIILFILGKAITHFVNKLFD